MNAQAIFDELLKARGLDDETARTAFLNPTYEAAHDPFLLPDMETAVERLVQAHDNAEYITIYGDYDVDGMTATSVLLDAFKAFGFRDVRAFMPNRFVEGYGLTIDAIERIAKTGAQLIVTVDCGSLSHKEVARANELGMDVIITDHHNVAETMPAAIATINPKRTDHSYPFIDLPGVGVAFKVVQALQTRLPGLEAGHEKWLLDLVALGTVCDVVTLVDENRAHVYWGLKVMQKTRRPGIKALLAIAAVEPDQLNARTFGFVLGPRLNAAGRLETAQHGLDLLIATDPAEALRLAQKLERMNIERRTNQNKIFEEASKQAERFADDPVLVVSSPGWSHGIVGIVAAKLLERFAKPTFVLEELGEEAKGSARSYGDFSAADAIRASDEHIIKGGGHKLAAGVTLKTEKIAAFRKSVNDFYRSQKLKDQKKLLLPLADITIGDFGGATEELMGLLAGLEPFGHGNPEPIFGWKNLRVQGVRKMGDGGQHVKIELCDVTNKSMSCIAFSAPAHFYVEPGATVDIWVQLTINEWKGRRSVEGRLLHLEPSR
jgi:single-stranded-DNA-specific exonuclease